MNERSIRQVHCFFEQSGTFKQVFLNLGIPAFDYDIQNNFGQTDYQIDLFAEIEKAYAGGASIFDNIGKDDLIMAFFPCIHFESMAMMYYDLSTLNIQKLDKESKYKVVMGKIEHREYFYKLIYKLYAVSDIRGIRLIIENPASSPHYLLSFQNFPKPTFIDKNRALRGDYFKKPTAYWFVNMTSTYGESYNKNTNPTVITKSRGSNVKGVCSEERSMISPEYAKNFIADFILGVPNENTLPSLF